MSTEATLIDMPVTTRPDEEEHLLAALDHLCQTTGWRTLVGGKIDEAICIHCGVGHYRAHKS